MYAKSSVNVRDLPSSDGEKLGKLSEGAEVKVTGQCNETKWYRIEYDGKVGYVSNKYLTTEKPEEEETEEYLPAGYSWEDRDGDGYADVPEYVRINGMNVHIGEDVSPEYAKFARDLSETELYTVMTFNPGNGNIRYYVLAPTADEAFIYLDAYLRDRGLVWGDGLGSWWDRDATVYCYYLDKIEPI